MLYPALLKELGPTFRILRITTSVGPAISFVLGAAKTICLYVLNSIINLHIFMHPLRGSPYLVQLYIACFVLRRRASRGCPLTARQQRSYRNPLIP